VLDIQTAHIEAIASSTMTLVELVAAEGLALVAEADADAEDEGTFKSTRRPIKLSRHWEKKTP
jgi:hypothetical protein